MSHGFTGLPHGPENGALEKSHSPSECKYTSNGHIMGHGVSAFDYGTSDPLNVGLWPLDLWGLHAYIHVICYMLRAATCVINEFYW